LTAMRGAAAGRIFFKKQESRYLPAS
jgi:hypothetical protein